MGNVPSALGIYWVANNIFTTLLTLQIRGSIEAAKGSSSTSVGAGAAVMEPPKTNFIPFEPERTPKPAGFGSSSSDDDDDGVKPITAPIDAEIVEEEKEVVEAEVVSKSQQKKRGKGKKKRSRKK